MKAQDWNEARSKAFNPQARTVRTRFPDDGCQYVVAHYPIDPDYKSEHDGSEQPDILTYSGCWLGYPRPTTGDKTTRIVDLTSQTMQVIPITEIKFSQLKLQSDWPMLAVAHSDIDPGGVGRFCIYGITPARCYSELLSDSPMHTHADYGLHFMTGSQLLLDADPAFVFLRDGSFTPYYEDSNVDNVPPIGARLLFRKRTTEVLTADKTDVIDYGLISLPVFFHQ